MESEAEQGFIHNDFDCSNCSVYLEFGLFRNPTTDVVLSAKNEDWFGLIFR
jgi:hypothetical protein